MQSINLVKTLKNISSGWVALSRDYKKVVYSGKTFSAVMNQIEKEKKGENFVLLPIMKNFRGFVA